MTIATRIVACCCVCIADSTVDTHTHRHAHTTCHTVAILSHILTLDCEQHTTDIEKRKRVQIAICNTPLSLVKHNVNMSMAWRDSIMRFLSLHWSRKTLQLTLLIISHWTTYCKWETQIFRFLFPRQLYHTLERDEKSSTTSDSIDSVGRSVQFYLFISFRSIHTAWIVLTLENQAWSALATKPDTAQPLRSALLLRAKMNCLFALAPTAYREPVQYNNEANELRVFLNSSLSFVIWLLQLLNSTKSTGVHNAKSTRKMNRIRGMQLA